MRYLSLLLCVACSSPSVDQSQALQTQTALDSCPTQLQRCEQLFQYADHGEDSVSVMGDYSASGWVAGTPMTRSNGVWSATVRVPVGKPVSYKLLLNGTQWINDPANHTTDSGGNSLAAAVTCATPVCNQVAPPPPGVFDWRDSVMYFVFVDRFRDGDPSNNCQVAGAEASTTSSTNYLGGDWVGVTQAINEGYFNALGVNTLWISVPLKNADDVTGGGVTIDSNGNAIDDGHKYASYHGYWPKDPTQTESCFGTPADLQTMVSAAHARGLKVLFDYAMVHVHTESQVYQAHKTDWFTPPCVCGAAGCGNFDTTCWFTDYLAHYDYRNADTRAYSINAAVQLIQSMGNDAFRLDAIKQVDPSWLQALRPAVAQNVLAAQSPSQRFYMVGETYDFQNRGLIRSMINSGNGLDGQFDFPLRIRLVETLLMRRTDNQLTPDDLNWSRGAPAGMQGLAQFMDTNDDFYPTDAVMSSFIGNHDLPRSIHYADEQPLWSDSADNGKNDSWVHQPNVLDNPNAYERLANAFAVIMTNKGAPLIYYGDEIGLPGAGDPDNRRMMAWSGYNLPQQALLKRMQALGQLRATHAAMRSGVRTTLLADADVWVYKLQANADVVYVAINRSDVDRTINVLPNGVTELLAGGSAQLVPARQTRIYK